MKPALLVIDVQQDFLERPDLESGELIARLQELLATFRHRGVPIFHIQTVVKADGSNGMAHWKSRNVQACLEGSPGALPPESLRPLDGETIVRKQSFSGFENGLLHEALQACAADTVVLAGLFTHGCIRATATDAYAKGYRVRIAADAVASAEPAHAEFSRRWMDAREMRFVSLKALFAELGWRDTEVHAAPAEAAVQAASEAQPAWAALPVSQRTVVLKGWAGRLHADRTALARVLASEIGKPVMDAAEEVERAIGHITGAAQLAEHAESRAASGFRVCYRPLGAVALITPWNNPLAIPAGKIAPALALGNAVVWKPSPACPCATEALRAHLQASGLPDGLLQLVPGGQSAVRNLLSAPGLAAVSFTGSNRAGRAIAAQCAVRSIPLQAELGGNNAALVLADADLDLAARSLALSAFGFAGQRCTATRRIIVAKAVWTTFLERLIAHTLNLRVGDPLDPANQIGPLISREHCVRVSAVVERALDRGDGRLLCGGASPGGGDGNWFSPTLIAIDNPGAPIVREETFGPVAVLLPAEDFAEALALCNAVDQGLAAILFSEDPVHQARFLNEAAAGLLRINPDRHPVHPDAPFLGWKSSGLGPAEHGRWDLEFYARPQAIYS